MQTATQFPFLKGDELRVFYPDIGLWHNGIVLEVIPGPFSFPSARVIHNSKSCGVCIVSLEEFSGGSPVYLNNRPPSEQYAQAIVARAQSLLGQPYDAVFHNCEHFTTWAFTGVPRSEQLQAIGWIAAIGAVVGLIVSESGDQLV